MNQPRAGMLPRIAGRSDFDGIKLRLLPCGRTGMNPYTVGVNQGKTYRVRTYGCQMNVHDSERLAGLL